MHYVPGLKLKAQPQHHSEWGLVLMGRVKGHSKYDWMAVWPWCHVLRGVLAQITASAHDSWVIWRHFLLCLSTDALINWEAVVFTLEVFIWLAYYVRGRIHFYLCWFHWGCGCRQVRFGSFIEFHTGFAIYIRYEKNCLWFERGHLVFSNIGISTRGTVVFFSHRITDISCLMSNWHFHDYLLITFATFERIVGVWLLPGVPPFPSTGSQQGHKTTLCGFSPCKLS